MNVIMSHLDTPHVRALVIVGAGIAIGLLAHAILFAVLRRIAGRTPTRLDDSLIRHLRAPARLIVLLMALKIVVPLLSLAAPMTELIARVTSILLICGVTWLVIVSTRVGRDVLAERFDIKAEDNLQARKVHTQYDVLSKIVIALAILLGGASILMTFEQVRQLGAGILASAGIVGIVVGFAAQSSLGTLFAGIQIALTQPIRLDDVVIVKGEWGRIEEITLTYVVLRIWDQRRLIVPIGYFLDEPFENWTRVSAELLGTVYLHADPTISVDAVREELQRIVESDERWDGRVVGLVVTDATERSMQLRALVSAADSGKAWELRCHVREQLLAFLGEKQPTTLPRLRVEMASQA